VTPFLAWLGALRADPVSAPEADLHYCTRQRTGDPFVARLQALCADLPGVRLHVHDSGAEGPPCAEMLGLSAGGRAEVWFCGPQGLADHLRAGLARIGLRRLSFHREAFEMR
jgi:predicted ferric reductase